MSYTASSQGVQTNCASTFISTLDGILTAAGFTFVEAWASTTFVRLAAGSFVSSMAGLLVVDGVQTVDGDRVLVPYNGAQSGIWVVHSGPWTRAADADASGEIYVGLHVTSTAGSSFTNRIWLCTATGATPWIPDSSTSTWSIQFNAIPTINIYKSPTASNGSGADWYLVVYAGASTATTVTFSVAEVWDTATKKLRNYAPSGTSAPAAGTFAVNDAVGVLPYSTILRQISVTISAAGFQYWISANTKRLVLTTRVSGSVYHLHAGLYDDLLAAGISPYPLIVSTLTFTSTSGAGTGAATREPNTTINNTGNFGVNLYLPVGLTSTSASGIYAGTLVPGRPLVYSSRVTAGSGFGATAVGARGLLKDILYLPVTGAVEGDTLTVTDAGGATKTYTTFAGTAVWVDQGV